MSDPHAAGCVIMDAVKPETEAWIVRAGERYAAADAAKRAARADLIAAMSEGKSEGAATEKIARLTPLSNTQVYRLITGKS
jgi:hypothetical protein